MADEPTPQARSGRLGQLMAGDVVPFQGAPSQTDVFLPWLQLIMQSQGIPGIKPWDPVLGQPMQIPSPANAPVQK